MLVSVYRREYKWAYKGTWLLTYLQRTMLRQGQVGIY